MLFDNWKFFFNLSLIVPHFAGRESFLCRFNRQKQTPAIPLNLNLDEDKT